MGFTDLFVASVEQPLRLERRFDLVIAGEILEHLSYPAACLRNVREVLRPGGELIITVPNAFSVLGFFRVLGGVELVHEDHVAYYSVRTLETLLMANGFRVRECFGYSDLDRLRGWKAHVKKALNMVLLRIRPQLCEGLVVLAISAEESGRTAG